MIKANLATQIKDIFIVEEYDGTYNLFGTYIIRPENGLYKVSIPRDPYFTEIDFSSLQYAVTWCVFEKSRKNKENKRVYELDRYIGALDVAIAQHSKLLKKRAIPDKYIYIAKLAEDKYKKRLALKELSTYTALSKYIQTKKFKEYQDEKSVVSDKYIY
jgi:hypothetical protein